MQINCANICTKYFGKYCANICTKYLHKIFAATKEEKKTLKETVRRITEEPKQQTEAQFSEIDNNECNNSIKLEEEPPSKEQPE